MAQRPARADVLDDILGATPTPTRRASPTQQRAPTRRTAEPEHADAAQESTQTNKPKDAPRRARMNVEISETLAARVRDAVIALSGPPVRLTLARFAEEAFSREIARLQAEHHADEPFPVTDRLVRVGRPVGVSTR